MSNCPAFWPVAAATIAALAVGLFFYFRALRRLLEEEPTTPELETPTNENPERYY